MNVIGIKRREPGGKITPIRAIRLKCLECAGSASLVRKCSSKDCQAFIYRLGRNPARRGIGGGLSNFKKKVPTQVGRFSQKRAL